MDWSIRLNFEEIYWDSSFSFRSDHRCGNLIPMHLISSLTDVSLYQTIPATLTVALSPSFVYSDHI